MISPDKNTSYDTDMRLSWAPSKGLSLDVDSKRRLTIAGCFRGSSGKRGSLPIRKLIVFRQRFGLRRKKR